jgi:hypothetical protein
LLLLTNAWAGARTDAAVLGSRCRAECGREAAKRERDRWGRRRRSGGTSERGKETLQSILQSILQPILQPILVTARLSPAAPAERSGSAWVTAVMTLIKARSKPFRESRRLLCGKTGGTDGGGLGNRLVSLKLQ